MSSKASLNLLKFKNKKRSKNILQRLELKSLVLPSVLEKDDSTINHIKRVGGQVLQLYSLHETEASIKDLNTYYYLYSDIYPVHSLSEDLSRHQVPTLEMSVYNTKLSTNASDEFASNSMKFLGMDLEKVITYTTLSNNGLKDQFYTKLPTIKFFDLEDYIRYTTKKLPVDSYAANSINVLSIDIESFPTISKSVQETSTTKINTLEINIE